MKKMVYFMLMNICTIMCAHDHLKNTISPKSGNISSISASPAQSSPIPIPTPKTAITTSYIEPGTSPSLSDSSTEHLMQHGRTYSMPTTSAQFSSSSQASSFQSDSFSPVNQYPYELLPRSMSVSPTPYMSYFPAQTHNFSPPSMSSSATPSAPTQGLDNNSSYGSSLPAYAPVHTPSAEQSAHEMVEGFKKFLEDYCPANRTKFVVPLLNLLTQDGCLVVAKVAAVKGAKGRNLGKLKDHAIKGTVEQAKRDAELALAALQKALQK